MVDLISQKFLLPWQEPRKRAIARIVDDIEVAIRHYEPKRVSVIAHSFGTYIFSEILTNYSQFRWHRIIFCGSIVREDFSVGKHIDRFDAPLLNEVGSLDILPSLAAKISPYYGSIGSHGFNSPVVENRWHTGYSHSDFLDPVFVSECWLEFLIDGKITKIDKPSTFLQYFNNPIFFLIYTLIFGCVVMLLFALYQ